MLARVTLRAARSRRDSACTTCASARELKVSRGSISANARILEERGVIERTTRPGDRQDYFQLTADPYNAVLRTAVERAGKAVATIRRTIEALPSDQEDVRRRLEEYERFYAAITEGIETAAERLKG